MTFVKKFYIADTHLLHARLLEIQPRAFGSIEEHDEKIIANWNSVVGDKDIVYHLGDFAFQLGVQAEKVRWYFSRLKGRKHLIIGNHDLDEDGNLHPTIASLDWAEPPQFMKFTNDGGKKLILCHYAIREWQGYHKGAYHFYGHSHGKLPGAGLSRDVGCDVPDVNFTPKTYEQLTIGMK
ncbi:metallophosphoesterase [Rhizobium sp. BK176]|uniref:metallophosphoesterase n=1 Tax=Rhizobium sp. BK176 TaxID=2587071 RepID=UPI002167EAFD|nr:metallophosphoesterase [Rhizobium sp. BK176]